MACISLAFPAPQSLIQIRRTFAAECGDLRFTIESADDGWRAKIRTDSGAILHSAVRYSLTAAKVAAVDYALLRAGISQASPDAIATELRWNQSW